MTQVSEVVTAGEPSRRVPAAKPPSGQSPSSAPETRGWPVLAVGLAAWFAFAAVTAYYRPNISNDSVSYVDCARSIADGRGFQERTSSGLDLPHWERMRLFSGL